MLYVLTHFISCPTQVLLSLFCKALSPSLSLALSLTPHYLHITSEHVRAHTDTHTSVCQRCCSRIWEHWRHGSDLSIDPNGKRVAGSTPGHPRGYWVGRGDRGRALGSDDTIGMAMMREIMGCLSRSKRGEGKGENCRLVIGGGDYVTWYVWRHIQPRPWAQTKECRMHSRPYNTHTHTHSTCHTQWRNASICYPQSSKTRDAKESNYFSWAACIYQYFSRPKNRLYTFWVRPSVWHKV